MKIHITFFITFLIFGLGGPKAFSQLPVTELWMLDINSSDKIESVSYLSGFNPKSYNNQAVFLNDKEIIMTAEIDKGNTDIVILNPKKKTWKRLTKTLENEYSPRPSGNETITTVRVEQDEESQVLWEYPINGNNVGSQVISEYNNIGYYHPLNNFKMALFVLSKTNDLQIMNLRSERVEYVSKDIGRCFQVSKTGELVFIQNLGNPTLKRFNPVNKSVETITEALKGSEDFVLYGEAEVILMAKGAQIFKYNPTAATFILQWDLSSYGIKEISRMDYLNGKLLLINKS
jgi:hypothetical protein